LGSGHASVVHGTLFAAVELSVSISVLAVKKTVKLSAENKAARVTKDSVGNQAGLESSLQVPAAVQAKLSSPHSLV